MATPVWVSTYPRLSLQTTDSATFLVKTDIDSTVFFVVVPQGSVAPSNIQVIAGQDHTGTPVSPGLSGTGLLLANIENSVVATLAPGTDYDIFLLAVGMPPFGTPQAVPFRIRFSTLALIIGQTLVPRTPIGQSILLDAQSLRIATPKTDITKFAVQVLPGPGYEPMVATNYYGPGGLFLWIVKITNISYFSRRHIADTRLVSVTVNVSANTPPSPIYQFKISVPATTQTRSKPVGYNISRRS